jgi:hypothetical protein
MNLEANQHGFFMNLAEEVLPVGRELMITDL